MNHVYRSRPSLRLLYRSVPSPGASVADDIYCSVYKQITNSEFHSRSYCLTGPHNMFETRVTLSDCSSQNAGIFSERYVNGILPDDTG